MDKSPEELAADADAQADTAKPAGRKVKARVLVNCRHGTVNQVAVVSAAELAADNAPEGPHELDASKAAVAYAEALPG